MSHNVKLVYFSTRGAGELTRLILAAGDIPYENVRVNDMDKWNTEIKPSTPFGQLPMLEWDGVKVAQSLAIARFVAKKAGLAGKDDLEQFQADSVIELVRDFQTDYYKTFHSEDKKAAASKFLAENVPKFLANAEKWLKEHGGEYFIGGKLTWADIAVMELLNAFTDPTEPMLGAYGHFDDVRTSVLKDFPLLTAHLARIKAVPAIKKWHEERPSNEAELESIKKYLASQKKDQ